MRQREKAAAIKRDFLALVKQRQDLVQKMMDAMVAEYVSEAEHQDGSTYWLHFETGQEALEDFGMYCKNKGEDEEEK